MPGVSFDRAVAYYDATRGLPDGVPEQVRDALVQRVGANPKTTFLEVGIGTGRVALPFIRVGDNYTGVDLSQPMVGELRRKLAALPEGAGQLKLVLGDAMHLPLRDAQFDVALMIHLLHLVDDWQQALAEVRRVLRPAGWLAVASNEWVEQMKQDEAAGRELAMPQLVGKQWTSILAELGEDRSRRPRGNWLRNDLLLDYFQSQGIRAERMVLAEYLQQPVTARELVGHYRDRLYSSDWHHSDELHTEAVRRLEHWLATEHPAPDLLHRAPATFAVLLARLP